jgi:DNA-binding CsgD family transcriptional regulator
MGIELFISFDKNGTVSSDEIRFFEAERWTEDTERMLLNKLHELLLVIPPKKKALQVTLLAWVDDPVTAEFALRRILKHPIKVENARLTIREIEVLQYIMQGDTNKEIATKLFLSNETIKTHRKNLLLKTGTKNTAALISYYHNTFFDRHTE